MMIFLTSLAAVTGFEPIPAESKSDVLPLHYTAITSGGFEETRTPAPLIKSQMLLPTELQTHKV